MPKHKTRAEGRDKPRPTPDIQQQVEAPEKQDGPRPAMPARGLTAPEKEAGAAGRARTVTDMQQTVGNLRISQITDKTIQKKNDESLRSTIDYGKAKRRNLRWARRLQWPGQLAKLKPAWSVLWQAKNYDAFADAVATFQRSIGAKGRSVDGVLGPRTWDRVRPVGDVIASRKRVSWEKSKEVCTIAAKERLTKGYRRATGKKLIPKTERKTVNRILQSYSLSTVERKYRGTGAAGALVYLGKGTFVSQNQIWNEKALQPGAALQVWGRKKQFEKLRDGKDIHPFGTAAVFIKYVSKNKMKVLHFDRVETWPKSRYEVWIGANLNER